MLWRLQNRYSKGDPPEVLEAEKVIAKFRKEKAESRDQIARASTPLQDADLCPSCWIMHGERNPLVAAHHPDPDKYDRMICQKTKKKRRASETFWTSHCWPWNRGR